VQPTVIRNTTEWRRRNGLFIYHYLHSV